MALGAGNAPSATSRSWPTISQATRMIARLRRGRKRSPPANATLVAIQRLRHLALQRVKMLGVEQGRIAWPRQVDIDGPCDPAGPARHDDDPVSEEHGFVDTVGDEERGG